MPRLIAVIQARTGSTRLPRQGVPRSRRAARYWRGWSPPRSDSGVCDEIVVATTTDAADDEVAALATGLGARVVRGPVDDVLSRFLLAADTVDAEAADGIVRLTSDCPLLDASVIAMCVHRSCRAVSTT